MDICRGYNQYYNDIVDSEGNLVTTKCFNGSIYNENFDVNDYKKYNNVGYYSWINKNFKDYAFSKEDYEMDEYDPNIAYDKICNNTSYSLKQQQKFAGRIFNTFSAPNSMLVYHGLGSGKTQTSIVIGEAFKLRKTDGELIPGRTNTRTLIVVPNALKEQYYNEIIGKYENGIIKSASGQIWIMGDEADPEAARQYYTDEAVRKQLDRNYSKIRDLVKERNTIEQTTKDAFKINELQTEINKLQTKNNDFMEDQRARVTSVYEIISHDSFLNRLFKIENKKYEPQGYLRLLERSNGLLIIDEIQNLISATGTNYRRLLYGLLYYGNKNFRTVMLTGTPIYDKPYEFGLLMNLLRTRVVFPDGRDEFNEVFLEFDAKGNGKMKNEGYFKKMCSGYISYFKGGNPVAYPYKKTTIMNHQMSEYQYDQYKKVLIEEVRKDRVSQLDDEDFFTNYRNEEQMNTGIFNNSRQFCNIAFPEITVTKRKDVLEQNVDSFNNLLENENKKNILLNAQEKASSLLKIVSIYSNKFSKVAEMVLNSSGPIFIYSNYVYYGVDAMGVIFKNLGYNEYPRSGPRGSYFIWNGNANQNKAQVVKDAYKAFNDPRNVNGSILKIMLGTQTVMEGVDFRNIDQIHILDPWWNDSRMQQVIARGIRLCSHRNKNPEDRVVNVFIHLSTLGASEKVYEVMINEKQGTRKVKSFMQIENYSNPDPSTWFIFEAWVTKLDKENSVEIRNSTTKSFKVSQIVEDSIIRAPDQNLIQAFEGLNYKKLASVSIQERMYNRSLQKLSINRQFERAIKEVAIDCSINEYGNIVRLEEMYTPNIEVNGTWNLVYQNYSTGENFIRLNTRSQFQNLKDNVFTLQDILANTAKNSKNFIFTNTLTGEQKKINKSLIVSENIKCDNEKEYTFKFPEKIVNLTINKELLPFLLKLVEKHKLKDFILEILRDPLTDRTLHRKLSELMLKRNKEKQVYVDELIKANVVDDEALLLTLPIDTLRIMYEQLIN